MTAAATAVYSDLRWPAGTGIGAVQRALLARVPENLKIVNLGVSAKIGSPLSPFAIAAALSRRRARLGVFWSPGYMPPLSSRIPAVVTVHDLTHLYFYSSLHRAYYNHVMKRLYRRCAQIICVSEYTRHEFLAWSGIPAERVHTVRNGVSGEDFRAAAGAGLPFPYVFYPGNHRPYKNLPRLLAAYARTKLPQEGIHLVMTGQPTADLIRSAVALGVQSKIHCLGRVTDAQVAGLYREARLVAFVSLYEGFGLPIIEGMACGVPVLTSNVSSMPETAGNAAYLVDPRSIADISEGLERGCFDEPLRERLMCLGRERARQFDWTVSAEQTWRIVNYAAEECQS
jgi:glycosyltransferase involved in cell wall biosynthesis